MGELLPAMVASGLDPRLHGVLSNPLRHAIMTRTAARPYCATELADATGESLKYVSKAIGELKKDGLLELVKKAPGPKGGTQHFYRAAFRFTVSAEEWHRLSVLEQGLSSAGIVTDFHRDMADALEAGTFYADADHVMLRDHRGLDAEGMKHAREILDEAYEKILGVVEQSVQRSQRDEADLIPIALGLALFRRAPEAPSS